MSLKELFNLQVRNKRRNLFQGILPLNIIPSCFFGNNQFYGNKLAEEIPRLLAKCEKLKFLDHGSNKLLDYLPYGLGTFTNWKFFLSEKMYSINTLNVMLEHMLAIIPSKCCKS